MPRRGARRGTTAGSCSRARTGRRCTRSSSAARSSGSSTTPARRRSGCTTCVTAPPGWPCPAERLRRSCRTCWGTDASWSDPAWRKRPAASRRRRPVTSSSCAATPRRTSQPNGWRTAVPRAAPVRRRRRRRRADGVPLRVLARGRAPGDHRAPCRGPGGRGTRVARRRRWPTSVTPRAEPGSGVGAALVTGAAAGSAARPRVGPPVTGGAAAPCRSPRRAGARAPRRRVRDPEEGMTNTSQRPGPPDVTPRTIDASASRPWTTDRPRTNAPRPEHAAEVDRVHAA